MVTPTTTVTTLSSLTVFHLLTILLGDFIGFQVTPWLPHQLCFMFISFCQRSILEWWDFCLKASSYIYSPAEKQKHHIQAIFTTSRKSPSLLETLMRNQIKKQIYIQMQALAYNTNSVVGYISNSEVERFYIYCQFPFFYQHWLKLFPKIISFWEALIQRAPMASLLLRHNIGEPVLVLIFCQPTTEPVSKSPFQPKHCQLVQLPIQSRIKLWSFMTLTQSGVF